MLTLLGEDHDPLNSWLSDQFINMAHKNTIHLYIIFCIILLCPVQGQSKVLRENVEEFITSERLAGNIPDIKRKFGNKLRGTNFSELNLNGVDLSGTELSSTNFKKTTLVGANLSTAHIYRADFEQANMQNVNFTDTNLDHCSFKNTDLRGAIKFGSNNKKWRQGVNAQEANLESTDLTGADLDKFDLTNANLSFAILTNASLANTKLYGANFYRAKLENTIFINALISNNERMLLSNKGALATKNDMEEAVENGVDFTGKNFESVNFSGFNLNGINLNNARLHSANLSGTQLQNAQLNKSFLAYSQIDNINLSNAQLKQCKFWRAEFNNVDLSNADFTGADLFGSTFINSNLEGTKFNGADLHETKFIGCNLQNTDFEGANIKYALFTKNNGISIKKENKLKRQAGRWRFEVLKSVNVFFENFYFYLYALFIVSTIILATFSRKKQAHKNNLWRVTTACNSFCLIPFTCIAFLLISGTGTVVQFNAGSSLHMNFWSLWVGVFMPLYYASIAILVALLISMSVLVINLLTKKIKSDKLLFVCYLVSSICLSFLSFYTLVKFMPTA